MLPTAQQKRGSMSKEFEIWFASWLDRHMEDIVEFHKRAMWDVWQASQQKDALDGAKRPLTLHNGKPSNVLADGTVLETPRK